ncbi:uncharacterized protein LOC119727638 isoform X2 [Patiria miniata]|uniref:HYR domain-containing protein n=1 Tax=Patiria miniata TaxID=46514 RepID=A0A913ZWU6_PATMI|nr:uncharacterized protein LOC119727638 isoform X2 [Patiria miniata]
MARGDDYALDFSLDPVYEYRNPQGIRGLRAFRPSAQSRPVHFVRKPPLYAAAAAPAAAAGPATPLVFAVSAVVILVLGAFIGIPLAVIFGVVLPNSTGVSEGTTQQPVIPPVDPPIVNPVTVPPARRTLLLRCPDDITEETQTGQNYAIVGWDPPRVLSRTEGAVQMTSSRQPLTQFNIGVRRVEYTVTDAANNAGACSFQVTVVDNEPPSIQCPPNMTVPTDLLSNSARVFWPAPTITENSGIVSIRQVTDEPGDQFHVGLHVVTIVIHDGANNENRCSFNIIVQDREDPRLTCPDTIVAYTNQPATGTAPASWPDPVVRDNSLSVLTATCAPASGSAFQFGTTQVICNTMDAAGNDDSCMFDVMVRFNDTEPPMFMNCLSDIVVNATEDSDSAFVTWVAPTANDNSLEAPTITVNTGPNRQYSIGTYQVIYTALDSQGNVGECRFTVRVQDVQDPVIMCPANFTQNTSPGQPDAIVVLPAATTSDNSMTSLMVTTDPSGSPVLGIGDHTVTYTVTDDSGNSASCDITVTIEDMEPPTFTPLSDIVVSPDEGQLFANVTLPLVSNRADNSGGPVTVTVSPSNSDMLPIGMHDFMYTVMDIYGNSVTFTITVTVRDMEPPSFMPPSDFTVPTDDGQSSAIVSLPLPTDVTDNSGELVTIMTSPANNSMLSIGPNVVMYTLTDIYSNTVTFTITITVEDLEDPVIMCPGNFTQNTDSTQPDATVTLPAATTSDNSMTSLTVTTDPSGSPVLGIGDHTVTYTVTDASGNPASCNITVTIVDNEPPSFTPPSDFTVSTDDGQSSAIVSLPLPIAVTDNSGELVTIMTSPANNSVLSIGPNVIMYTLTDINGNTMTFSITVTVEDNQPPNLVCPANITRPTDEGMAFANVTYDPLVLTDNDGNTPALTTDYQGGDIYDIGETIITLTARDNGGNEISCTFSITVIDSEDPVIICPANITQNTDSGQPDATVILPAATTSDNSMTSLTVTTDPSGSPVLGIGDHTVTYTVTDDSGNSASCNITVMIIDVEPPTFTPPSNFTVSTGLSNSLVFFPLPTDLSDNGGGEITVTTSPVNGTVLPIGIHVITYTIVDVFGVIVQFTIQVTIVDNQPPNLVCPANITRPTDEGMAFANVTYDPLVLTDNDGNTPALTTDYQGGDIYDIGETIVTLTARDNGGNEISCTFSITVIDSEDPVIICPANITQNTDSGQPDATVILPAATTSDNSMTSLTVTTDPSGSPVLGIGDHTVTYTVTDDSGNPASCNITVMIIDVEPPTFTPPSNFTVSTGLSNSPVFFPLPTDLSDNGGGEITVTTSPVNGTVLPIGIHVITYTIVDVFGVIVQFTIQVTIVDNQPPNLVCPANITRPTDDGVAFANVTYDPLVLTDNDGNTPALTTDYQGGDIYNIGETIVMLTARDNAGNDICCTFSITVIDTEPPTLQCPSEVIVYSDELRIPAAAPGSYLFADFASWTVNITDNSGQPLTRSESSHESGSYFTASSTTVTHTATDAYNNTNRCSFDVRIIGFVDTTCSMSGSDLDLSVLAGTGVRYHLLSPNFDVGDPYPSNIECLWRVSAPSGSYIRVDFGAFETEFGKDILTIGSGLDETQMNTSLAAYGGKLAELVTDNTRHTKARVYGDTIWLHFVSDATFAQLLAGFWLRFDYITDPRTMYPSSYSFCAEFGGFPCLDGSCIDNSKRCDGNTNDCASNEDETDCPDDSVVTLPTQSANFPSKDGVYHTDIVSDNYPGEYRPSNARWDIDTSFVQSLRIVVMDLQIAAGDSLYVVDGDTGTRVTDNIVSPVSIHLTNNTDVAVVFESNGGTGRGFWIRVWRYISITTEFVDFPAYCEVALHSLNCGKGSCISDTERCDRDVDCGTFGNDQENCMADSYDCGNTAISLGNEGSMYHLTSVNYPNDFIYDISCQYVVTTSAATILVSFRDVEIPATTPEDYLRIGNGATVSDETEIIRVGGVFLPEDVVSTGNHIWIEFISDGRVNSRGFWIVLVAQDSEDLNGIVIICPANITQDTDSGQPDTTVVLPAATTSGNMTSLTVTTDPSGSPVLGIGDHTVTYTVTDDSGNSASCSITVMIVDVEPPSFTPPSDFMVPTDHGQSSAIVSLPLPTDVTDNSGELVTIMTSPANNSMLSIGPYVIMYTVTDFYGNTVTFDITVTVEDNQPPNLMCPANITRPADEGVAFANVTYDPLVLTDNDGNTPALTTDYQGGDIYDIGETIVMLTARDNAGNDISCTFSITVIDSEDPVIICPANITQNADSGQPDTTVVLPAATTSDNSMTSLMVTTDPSGSPVLGIGDHTVTYTVTDDSGNSASCDITVTIVDVEPPSFTPPSDFMVPTDHGQSSAIVSLPLPTDVTDNSGELVTIMTSPANNSVLSIGPHVIMYTVTDFYGNTVTFDITVTVEDNQPPNLTCPANITRPADEGVAFANVTYDPLVLTDNDGNTPALTTDYQGGDIYNMGETIVTLTAQDNAGNEISCTFSITVIDTEPPTLQCPSEVIVYSDELRIPAAVPGSYLFADFASWTVNITDNSGQPLTRSESSHESGSYFTASSTTVTHTATDAYNNTNRCSFDVRIIGFVDTTCSMSGSDLDLSVLAGTGVRYHLLSPNFDVGNPYPSSTECLWRVSAPSGSYIRVDFGAFETEFGKDVLTIGSGPDETQMNTSLAAYGGKLAELVTNNTRHTKARVYGDTIWLHFVSDSTFAQLLAGFWLRFDYITDPRTMYPSSYSFCAEFGGFPCLDGSCIDNSKRCDGTNNDCASNEDETDCPDDSVGTLPTQSANFPSKDGVYHTDIVSDNYPGEYRPSNARWDIDTNFVQSLRIVVMDLQIAAGDSLYVVDGDTGTRVTDNIVSPVSIHLTNNTDVAVVFESNGGTGRGFWIRVWRYISITTEFVDFPAYCEVALHSLNCGEGTCISDTERCDGDVDCDTFGNDQENCEAASYDCGNTAISLGNEGSMYHLTSVNYPDDFIYGISCQYVVTTSAATILVSFRDVEIPATTAEDYLRIGNGATVSDETEIIRVGGVFLPEDVVSTGNQIWIEFISDRSVNSRGFWIVLVAQG